MDFEGCDESRCGIETEGYLRLNCSVDCLILSLTWIYHLYVNYGVIKLEDHWLRFSFHFHPPKKILSSDRMTVLLDQQTTSLV
jgi:hypothetical protein